jgi:hypothetical protein
MTATPSKKTKKSSKKAAASSKKLESLRNDQDTKSLSAFMLFIVTSAISLAYYVQFKTYHASLKTLDSLKTMLANPNARVAAGAQGKVIMDKIRNSKRKA